MKEGLRFQVGEGELDSFYQVFCTNMRDLGTPVLPYRWFELLRERMADTVRFAAVYQEDLPVAGACGFVWRGEFEITWASSLRSHNRIAPNMLLYWGLMEHVIDHEGVALFDFGRCRPGGNTHAFKRQWGGTEDIPLPWIRAGYQADDTLEHDSSVLQAASWVWQRLPLALANRLGPTLSRVLP